MLLIKVNELNVVRRTLQNLFLLLFVLGCIFVEAPVPWQLPKLH